MGVVLGLIAGIAAATEPCGDFGECKVLIEINATDGDPIGSLEFSVRVPGDISPMEVTVPADYLASLPADTPVKIEVGAIGGEDNATFTEEVGFCVNEIEGCDD